MDEGLWRLVSDLMVSLITGCLFLFTLSDESYTYVEMGKARILTAVIHKEEDMYVAECPEVGTF